jgi:hypothetical protein
MLHSKHRQSERMSTTVGDVINAFYEAAFKVLGDKALAQRVAALLAADALRRAKHRHVRSD